MSKTLSFIIACVFCIIFDIAARQTMLLANVYLLPALIISASLVALNTVRSTTFLIMVSIISVIYGLVMPLNLGILILSVVATSLLWMLATKFLTLPISPTVTQILVFFNVWGLLLIITKSPFGLAQYIVYLVINTLISLVLYVIINRIGISKSEPKLKYR